MTVNSHHFNKGNIKDVIEIFVTLIRSSCSFNLPRLLNCILCKKVSEDLSSCEKFFTVYSLVYTPIYLISNLHWNFDLISFLDKV